MATKEFKEELTTETAAKTRKATKQEEQLVELYVDYTEGDDTDMFIGVANEEMSRTFLLKKGEYMKVPKIVADIYNDSKRKAAEAHRRQQALQNKEIATM